ncbi:MAG: hypothetical protein JWN27_481 [Candidatus Eremiobacteraeota bacterium]|nr:hypothetical protein [Candidatus Eremiobacteraeota bacterium]
MTLQLLPALLAVIGTALLAIAIFAPPAPARPVAVAFVAPVNERAVERRAEPAWPRSIDARATTCDANARLALADALATVRAPWAEAILASALENEHDDAVRAVIGDALRRAAAARRSA